MTLRAWKSSARSSWSMYQRCEEQERSVLNKQEINWKIDALDGVDKQDSHAHMKIWKWWWRKLRGRFHFSLSCISHEDLRSSRSVISHIVASIIHGENCSSSLACCCRVCESVTSRLMCHSSTSLLFVCSSRHFHTIRRSLSAERKTPISTHLWD